ncbi:UDP-glucose 4-epimerase [Lipingzhangella halophila]|uniref:UDP-glucose 4-epimerase n=1 Tax=Lipingzhangella halophila TaxID=1783352 RepID=A0A7W7RM89_9ACTN|nr:NAD-dependent epimerase/dehydratase family protein [Lipingzhangella halophila]MBB4934163.1 UDP-glucose 4-epimerase [Lipingzhangella halophila]
MARVVLVTGVSQYLGARAVQSLQDDPDVDRVIGVDSEPPRLPIGAAEFVHTDVCGDEVDRVIRESGADTVLHLGLLPASGGPGGTEPAQESTLVGTMQVLAACQRSATVNRLVLRSSAAVDAREGAEVERYTRGLARRRPDLSIAVLRFANVIGPSMETPLTRYLGMRIVPKLRGYDPRMQFIHEEDGVEVLRRMALGSGSAYDGFFDVAAPGAMPLSACLRRVGRPGIPVPERGLRVLGGLGRRRGGRYSPERLRRLCYGRVLDTGQLERTLEWTPTYTSQQAFEAYVSGRTSARFERSGPPARVGPEARPLRAAVGR